MANRDSAHLDKGVPLDMLAEFEAGVLKKAFFTGGFLLPFLCASQALANSSWVWLTPYRPWHVLPLAIVVTVITETLIILRYGTSMNTRRTILAVCLANIASFLSTYIFAISFPPVTVGVPYDLDVIEFAHKPIYSISGIYLAWTLAIEIPVVYFVLRKVSNNRKRLLLAIVVSNIITTIFTGMIERFVARGVIPQV